MKRIVKSSSPAELTKWFKAQPTSAEGKLNCRYCDLPSDIRTTVKQRLLQDQGYLCCYTGIRINQTRSHIEHLKPQSRYFSQHEDIDYNNLLAAYPGSAAKQCKYGAHAKTDWYDDTHFIDPLSPQCETAFRFDLNGKITAHKSNIAAQTTLEQLNLTDDLLTEMREQAIQTVLFDAALSLKQAEKLLEKIYDRNAKGELRPFCFVLKQACQEYIRRVERKQARKKAIQSQSKSAKKGKSKRSNP